MKTAIVIGSGFGGIATAIRLQAQGIQTKLFEKNDMIGGHASQLKIKGYTFDMGPSLITAPHIIESVFKSAGKSIEDYLDLSYLDPFYRLYFHDKTSIDYTAHSNRMKEQMSKINTDDANNYDRFVEYTRQLHKAVIFDGLGSESFSFSKLIQFLPTAIKLKAFQNCYKIVSKFFKDPKHRFLFSFHSLFIGGNPFNAPSVYLMIPYLEKSGGVWFTKGGMYSLVKAFEKVFLDLGGQIHLQSEVEKIVIEQMQAIGIQSKGEFHQADIVVSNAHFAHTHLDLIKQNHRKKWTNKRVTNLSYSMSAFLLYIGVRKTYSNLLHHTLILSKRYKGLIEDIFDKKILADDFSIYLHTPTKSDTSMAPEGCESMYVLIPVPNLDSPINWTEKKDEYKERILTFLESDFGLTDLKKNLEVCEVFTPDDFKTQRNNYLGAAWGPEPRLTQSASFRPANKSEDIDNFYLVGAGTHPGAGVPGVLLSAEATVKEIIQNHKIREEEVVHDKH